MNQASRAWPSSGLEFTKKSGSVSRLFASPAPAGRRIAAGFTWLQRIGKPASIDVWFPDCIRDQADEISGIPSFPAEWAAVRQFELLQEAGNHKIYDLDSTNLTRTLQDITRSMRGGGYRVTVVTIGGYAEDAARDELEILDRRLQGRIARLINMLYLEEQSEALNAALAASLCEERWDYQMALPHVGATLGARDLFRPPLASPLSEADRRHRRAQRFFEILDLLPHRHIQHDVAIGLQLPEAINENQWIYIAPDGEKIGDFVRLMDNLFAPFNKISLGEFHGRGGAEIKPMVSHMPGYGDRLRPESEHFYRGLARYAVH